MLLNAKLSGRTQPRASVRRTIPNELVGKVTRLLDKFKEVPLILFSQLFFSEYGQLLEASHRGYEDGLMGFFRDTQLVSIESTDKGYMCRLKEPLKKHSTETTVQQVKVICKPVLINNAAQSREHWIFDIDQAIWQYGKEKNGVEELLSRPLDSIKIAESPLEVAFQRNAIRVKVAMSKIQHVMSQFPDGIPLNQICTHVHINKKLFNTNSIDTMVQEFPELFYVVESNVDGQEKLVFDGRAKTIDDLSGSVLSRFKTNSRWLKQITFTIVYGLYQRTLILIKAAGPNGLKLASWRQSLENNFDIEELVKNHLLKLTPLTIMLSWAMMNLVILRSPEHCKNDLRVMLPKQRIDFDDFIDRLYSEIRMIEQKDREDTWRSIRTYGSLSTNTIEPSTEKSSLASQPRSAI